MSHVYIGVCHTVGETHYFTFDQHPYDFKGDCSYILSKDVSPARNFEIIMLNVPCGTQGVACSKNVEILLKHTVISLLRGREVCELATYLLVTDVRELISNTHIWE